MPLKEKKKSHRRAQARKYESKRRVVDGTKDM